MRGIHGWMIEIINAYDRGEQIQQRPLHNETSEWVDVSEPDWNFAEFDYRVRPTLMTYRQLSEWMAKGFGEVRQGNGRSYSRVTYLDYWGEATENNVVSASYEIRYWQTAEWLKPTVAIYQKDCMGHKGGENEIQQG